MPIVIAIVIAIAIAIAITYLCVLGSFDSEHFDHGVSSQPFDSGAASSQPLGYTGAAMEADLEETQSADSPPQPHSKSAMQHELWELGLEVRSDLT